MLGYVDDVLGDLTFELEDCGRNAMKPRESADRAGLGVEITGTERAVSLAEVGAWMRECGDIDVIFYQFRTDFQVCVGDPFRPRAQRLKHFPPDRKYEPQPGCTVRSYYSIPAVGMPHGMARPRTPGIGPPADRLWRSDLGENWPSSLTGRASGRCVPSATSKRCHR